MSPALGRVMDRRGPRLVIETGVAAMAAGFFLATIISEPWHLYLTFGVLVGAGGNCLGYTGHALFLPNWFLRRRGFAMSLAFSGVGVGSIILLPWLGTVIDCIGWRAARLTLGVIVLTVLAPLNLLVTRRPEDLGLEPDGLPSGELSSDLRSASVVDHGWAAVDWTLGRALRTARFWWIATGYFAAMFAWYAVQVHQTKYLVDLA